MATVQQAHSLFSFEPSDLRLKVKYKGDLITAHVSSSAMSFASSVWKKFIFPPWKPIAANDPPTQGTIPVAKRIKTASDGKDKDTSCSAVAELDFKDDNGEALLILLRIAHLRFHDIPSTLPYQTLLSVAVLCDQYQCINLVRPWLSCWLVNEVKLSTQFGNENWLFIAWVFGREKVFQALAVHLVRIVKPIKNCLYVIDHSSNKKLKINEPMPPGIVGKHLYQNHVDVCSTDSLVLQLVS